MDREGLGFRATTGQLIRSKGGRLRPSVGGATVGLLCILVACSPSPTASDQQSAPPVAVTPMSAAPTAPMSPISSSAAISSSTIAPIPSPAVAPVPPLLAEPRALSENTFGLTAELDQYREDVASERILIRIRNGGTQDVKVNTLRLSWPGLSEVEPVAVDFNIIPLMKVGLSVPYGRAFCSTPAAVVEPVPDVPIAAVADTSLGEIILPVTDPLEVLRRLYQPDCERQAIEDNVIVDFAATWVDGSSTIPRLDGTLVLTRTKSDRPVTVMAISGSVLLIIEADGLPVTLAAGQQRLEIPIHVTNGRCDGHALGESKQTYLFQLGLALDGEAADLLLRPDTTAQEQMFASVIGKCPPTNVTD